MLDLIRQFDAFPKPKDDLRIKTNSGALVSMISIALMAFLFSMELSFYMKTEVVDHLYVNTTRAAKLRVSFDFSFPEISCGLLSLDAVDDTGLPQKDAVHEIYKHKLVQGEKVGSPEKHEILGETLRTEEQIQDMSKDHPKAANSVIKNEPKSSCGNCYGAGTGGQCCNSCNDVRLAYARKGWVFKAQGIKQCESEAFQTHLKDQFAEDGGCQIYGILELNKASGHFHIAPHKKNPNSGSKIRDDGFDGINIIRLQSIQHISHNQQS